MEGHTRERWMELCEQAAKEQDSERLLVLVEEITELLQQKQARLYQQRLKLQSSGTGSMQNENQA